MTPVTRLSYAIVQRLFWTSSPAIHGPLTIELQGMGHLNSPDQERDHDGEQELHGLKGDQHQLRLAEPEHVLLVLLASDRAKEPALGVGTSACRHAKTQLRILPFITTAIIRS